jgi:hypothetical protein
MRTIIIAVTALALTASCEKTPAEGSKGQPSSAAEPVAEPVAPSVDDEEAAGDGDDKPGDLSGAPDPAQEEDEPAADEGDGEE